MDWLIRYWPFVLGGIGLLWLVRRGGMGCGVAGSSGRWACGRSAHGHHLGLRRANLLLHVSRHA